MTSKVASAARQGYPDPQPTHYRRNTLLAIFFGAIVYSYAHQWTCDSLRGTTQEAWWEYQTAKNRCEAAQIYQYGIPESQGALFDSAQRVRQACERAMQAKEKLDYIEGWHNALFCNP